MMAPAADSIIVPASYAVRLSIRPPEAVVVVAPPGVEPTLERVMAVPALSTMLTHGAGRSWPDVTGAEIARQMLAGGGSVLLVFDTFADALMCHGRLTRERAA